MNIVTYANPVSVQPNVRWSLSLYKNTQSHHNFNVQKWGVLQLLTTNHIDAIELLGKKSGRDVDKIVELRRMGHSLCSVNPSKLLSQQMINPAAAESRGYKQSEARYSPIVVFEDCPCMILLEYPNISKKFIEDVGDHDLFICDAIAYFDIITGNSGATGSTNFLSTDQLRKLNII